MKKKCQTKAGAKRKANIWNEINNEINETWWQMTAMCSERRNDKYWNGK